jgi:coronin-1B/1C/6
MQVFLWRVPENFTLHSDVPADEVQDIAPVGKLSGHPKYELVYLMNLQLG